MTRTPAPAPAAAPLPAPSKAPAAVIRPIHHAPHIPPYALVAVGGISGFFSALAGAGGAIIAIPLLLALGYPALQAIGISQTTVLVIAITATVGNLSVGQIELIAGSVIAVALVVGILIGTRVAHALPINTLRNIVACVLVLVAISIAFQIARGTLTL